MVKETGYRRQITGSPPKIDVLKYYVETKEYYVDALTIPLTEAITKAVS